MTTRKSHQQIEDATWIGNDRLIIRHGGTWAFKLFGLFLIGSGLGLGLPLILAPPSRNAELAMIVGPLLLLLGSFAGVSCWNWRLLRVFDRDRKTLFYGWRLFGTRPSTELPFEAVTTVTSTLR